MDPIESPIDAQRETSRRKMIKLARKHPSIHEGEIEIDDDAVVSWGADDGAYVQVWLWVDFSKTELDKDA